MSYRDLAVMGERPGGVPGTRQRIRRSWARRMSGIVSVGAAAPDVSLNALDVQLVQWPPKKDAIKLMEAAFRKK